MLTIYLFCSVLALLLGGALFSLLFPRAATAVACAASVAAGIGGLVFSLILLLTEIPFDVGIFWPLPTGTCRFAVDRLSAVFLPPIFLLSVICGALLPGRLKALAAENGVHLAVGRHCCFFCLLILGMVMCLTAADSVMFIISWEVMSLMPLFLISPLDRNANERFAVWLYIVAAHLGVLPLLLLFAGMGMEAGGSGFDLFARHGEWRFAGMYFVLALAGFGLKAGVVPLHVWMPEAHTSAPGHVAVLLSGATLNVGLYGIARVLVLAGPPEGWWAYALMATGALSGVIGILLGLVQADIKRTLAYSSAENMGIVCLALGGALLAGQNGLPAAAAVLSAGALLHIWNHSIFKSLLFLAANAVKEHTHTTLIQRLGGLQKRIPFTGGCFALGSAAIAGIPPLNGFMGELLFFIGFGLAGGGAGTVETSLPFWLAFFTLGGIAGMALFAFVRAYGLAFLGVPRTADSQRAEEPETILKASMLLLAGLCLCGGFVGPGLLACFKPCLLWLASVLYPSLEGQGGLSWYVAYTGGLDTAAAVLRGYATCGIVLMMLFALIGAVRRQIVAANGSVSGQTWACGYFRPTARMQYTGASFSRPFASLLKPLARTGERVTAVNGLFPGMAKIVTSSPDWASEMWTRALFRPVAALAEAAKNIQAGLVNLYILYIFVALVAALTWALGWA